MVKKTMPPLEILSGNVDAALVPIARVVPTRRLLAAGTSLFLQGDKTFGIFRLVSGQLRLLRTTPNGSLVPMHTVRCGELFAEASIFSDFYHCDAIAVSDCEVLIYQMESVKRNLREHPEDLWALAAELAHRVQGLRTRMETRQIRSAKERVLHALRLKCDPAGVWKLDCTLKNFAEEIGLTHEALYRALASLERTGNIARNESEIKLRADVPVQA